MRDLLTDRSQRVLDTAFLEAKTRGHALVGVEHILLGLVREGTGITNNLLALSGVSEERILEQVEAIDTGGNVDGTRLSEGAKQGLTLAQKVAAALGQKFIGPDVIIVGVLQTDEAGGAALGRLGIDAEDLRDQILTQLKKGVAQMREATGRHTRATRLFTREMSGRLDPDLKKVMAHSRRISLEGNRSRIGSEHLLLALYEAPDGPAGAILREAALSGDPASGDDLRSLVLATEPSEIDDTGGQPITQQVNEIIELAAQEADDLGHGLVTPQHLLLAVLKHPGCAATRILHDRGADLHYLHAKVDHTLDG